jgi:hypothetical protein
MREDRFTLPSRGRVGTAIAVRGTAIPTRAAKVIDDSVATMISCED